ncbi:MAG TPA: hypothetical protein VFM96_12825 [Gaiellaceae bacterium]|nr:hypothetical protein [Gaiellaceae bacterium]
MTEQTIKAAEDYIKHSLKTQQELGYSAKVDRKVYDSVVRDTARAVQRLQRAQRGPAASVH